MDEELFIELQRLFKLMHDRGIRELAITQPEFAVRITSVQAGSMVIVPAQHAATAAETTAPVEEEAAGHAITSPLVGTFYRSPSPDAATFVEIGDTVEIGQVIGIVEAMKVFNEITADAAGRVLAIPAENGKLVQVGQPLVVVEAL